jgi:cell division protein FtsB
VAKTVSHRGKISISKKLRDEAKAENDRLKKELKDFNMLNKIEAIARNKFKMTEDDEVVVI